MTGRVRVRVPASTANLGPGFDALGLALALYDEVEVTLAASGLRVEVHGEGAGQVPTDEEHLVVRALRAACARLDYRPDGLVLHCHNSIPHARGLGSSAAAAVAGVLAGYALAGREPDAAALDLAARFDGHADNAGASLLGGLVISWRDGSLGDGSLGDGGLRDGGAFRAIRLEPHPDLAPVLFVPRQRCATEVTRGLLPAAVPHADAAFTAGRAALLVHALTAAPALLLAATEDRLHQPHRRSAYPATGRLVDALRAAGVPAAVSGAGPAVLALPASGGVPTVVDTAGFTRHHLDIARDGAAVTG
ncbi:MAG: homoserine kinase [Pseudonocardiaceae bacterium]